MAKGYLVVVLSLALLCALAIPSHSRQFRPSNLYLQNPDGDNLGFEDTLDEGDPDDERKQIALAKCRPFMTYTLRPGESCGFLLSQPQRFGFNSLNQINSFNRDRSGFRCGQARAGQVLCINRNGAV